MTLGAVLIGVVTVRLAQSGVVINSREGVYPSTLIQNDHQARKGHQSFCSCSTAGQLFRGVASTADGSNDDPIFLAIRELVPHIKGEDITQRLGYLLRRSVGRIVGGFVLRKVERSPQGKSKGGNRYFIEKIGSKDAANSDFYGEEVL